MRSSWMPVKRENSLTVMKPDFDLPRASRMVWRSLREVRLLRPVMFSTSFG